MPRPHLLAVLVLAACGGKSSPAPVDQGPPPPTCAQVGDRAARDITAGLPKGAPADAGQRFGAMIAKLCTDDQWPADVIACGITADKPRDECSPKLDQTQRAHIDEAQAKFGQEILAEMGRQPQGELKETGMINCDILRTQVAVIAECDEARKALGEEALAQMVGFVKQLETVPDDQKDAVDQACVQAENGPHGNDGIYSLGTKYHCFEDI